MNKKFWHSLILALLAALVALPGSALAAGQPVGGLFPVGNTGEAERRPAVAYNSTRDEYLVVYYNDRPGFDDIRAERISHDGDRLGGVWVSAGKGADRQNPDVAYNPQLNQYLVVWEHDGGIRAQRLSYNPAGELELKGSWFDVGGPCTECTARNPAVAYAIATQKYLVVWDTMGVFDPGSIFAQVVLDNGTPWGSSYKLANGTWDYSHTKPDVAYNRSGNGFLVVWDWKNRHSETVPVPHSDICGLIVDGGGSVMSPSPIKIMSSQDSEANPSVAAIPLVVVEGVPIKGQFMVAAEFYNPKLGRATSDIATILVNADGSLGGPGTPTILSSPFFPDLNPAIAGSEGLKQFLVTWSSYIETKQGDPIPILFGQTFLTITGAPDGNTYDLYYNFPETYPAVASGSQGDFLVTSTLGQIYGRLWGIP